MEKEILNGDEPEKREKTGMYDRGHDIHKKTIQGSN